MRPHTVYVAHVLATGVTLFAAALVMDHGGLDLSHQGALGILFLISHWLILGAVIAAIKEETEGGDE